MDALTSMGCFEARYPTLTSELCASLFGSAKDLVALPAETKLLNSCDPEKPFYGYLANIPGLDNFESLPIMEGPLPPLPQNVKSFADLMWPDGNPGFCEKASYFAKQLTQLEETIRRMVLESLGVSKYLASLTESTWYRLRFSQYKTPNFEEKNLGISSGHQYTEHHMPE